MIITNKTESLCQSLVIKITYYLFIFSLTDVFLYSFIPWLAMVN